MTLTPAWPGDSVTGRFFSTIALIATTNQTAGHAGEDEATLSLQSRAFRSPAKSKSFDYMDSIKKNNKDVNQP